MPSYDYLAQAGAGRGSLIKALQLAQERDGYVSDEALREIARRLSVSEAEAEGVLSFYAQFKRSKPGRFRLCACDGTACHIKGSTLIQGWISAELGIRDGESTPDGLFSLTTVACLGCCSLAPVMSVNGKIYGKLDRKALVKIIDSCRRQQ